MNRPNRQCPARAAAAAATHAPINLSPRLPACLLVGLLAITLAAAAGCGDAGAARADGADGDAGPDPDQPYAVTTTVGMITDIVRRVGGPRVEVRGIISEGVDPHVYKPTVADLRKLDRAQVIFYNGLMLEGKMVDSLLSYARRGKPVYAVTESIFARGDYVLPDDAGHSDPHVWMDVAGWMQAVEVVADALSEYDPDHAADYRARADAYLAELGELDDYARRVIGSIPESQRVLVTAHDAFRYLGRAYDIDVRGIQGLSTESEAGLADIEALVDDLVSQRIPAVFVETSVPEKNVRALVEGARAQGHEVVVGGELFSDAMGPAGTYEGTYIGMIDHNVTTIARALGGEAPARGMRGQLAVDPHHE